MDSDLEGILPASLFTHRITLKLTLITVITGSFFYSFYPLEWVLYEMLATPLIEKNLRFLQEFCVFFYTLNYIRYNTDKTDRLNFSLKILSYIQLPQSILIKSINNLELLLICLINRYCWIIFYVFHCLA